MSHKSNVFLLRCWKCRKCVANSDCLIRDGERVHFQKGVDSTIYQGTCNIWHVEAEESPDWIKTDIEKVHWTAGKLNCPNCRSRLGAFNFLDITKCTCGLRAAVRLCKSKIDVGCSVTDASLVSNPLSTGKRKEVSCNKISVEMMEPFKRKWDQTCLIADKYKSASGLLMEALCLEVPASKIHMEQACLQTARLKEPNTDSRENKRTCIGYLIHRKSKSLDTDLKKFPELNVNFMMLQMSQKPSDASILSSSSADQHSFGNRSLAGLKEFSGNTSTVLNDLFRTRITHDESSSTTLSASISNVVPPRTTPTDVFQATAESAQVLQPTPTWSAGAHQRLTKREINKRKKLRRKQRKREKWMRVHRQINISNLRREDEDEEDIPEKESYTCAVCLDVYFNPHMCYPCQHVFCEPCLRTLARDNPSRTPCPLCRTIIAIVHFQTDLSKSSSALFPNEYLRRKQSFQRASCSKWPLPSCNRLFRVLGDFRRRIDRIGGRQFPHAGYRFDFEDESHGWRFNLDMIIIYFYSMNWFIGLLVFCFLCYYFFLAE